MALSVAFFTLAVAGCRSTDEDVPVAAGRSGGPVNTGTFPNLNIPQTAAAPQLTEDEKNAKLASLRAAQERQSPGSSTEAASEANKKRLKLMAGEQADTLKVIEGN